MAFIDGTVINVALPVLQSDLHTTISGAQWVVNAYLLALSSLILVGGSLGDRFGLVRVFAMGVAVFAAASIWCGLAPSLLQLLVARTVQGVGAALQVPQSLAIITRVFPTEERGRAIGKWSALTAIATIAGPPLGGVLVQTFSWRAVFFINVPIAVAILWICFRLPAIRGDASGSIDWAGVLLVVVGLGGLTWALIEAPQHRGARWIGVALAACAWFAAFIIVERRVAQPVVPPALFRSRAYVGANALTLFLYGAVSGAMFLLPFELIQIRHYSPAEAGAAFLPMVVTLSALSPLSGALADRVGVRLLLIVGPLIVAAGFGLLVLGDRGASFWTAFAPGLFALGIGMGITVAPLTTTVMNSVKDTRHAGAASGFNNAVARVAGLLATAIFGAAVAILFAPELDRQLAAHGATPQLRQAMAAQAMRLAAATPPRGSDAQVVAASIRIAFQKGFAIAMLGAAALAIISVAFALMEPAKRRHPA